MEYWNDGQKNKKTQTHYSIIPLFQYSNFFTLRLIFFILFALVPLNSAHPQTLTGLYVTESGGVLGAIFALDVRFPAHALVKGNGVLVWVNVEVPGAIVEVNLYGRVSLVERMPPGSVSYKDGRISQIGDLRLEYDSGKIRAIGDLLFDYYGWGLGQTGRVNRIDNMPVVIENGFLVGLGSIRLEYKNGLISKIDDLGFFYESGRVQRIGDVRFTYDYGTLKKVTGEIPGIALKISSVVELRRSIR